MPASISQAEMQVVLSFAMLMICEKIFDMRVRKLGGTEVLKFGFYFYHPKLDALASNSNFLQNKTFYSCETVIPPPSAASVDGILTLHIYL